MKKTFEITKKWFGKRYSDEYEKYIGRYVMRELNFGETLQAQNMSIEYSKDGKRGKPNLQLVQINNLLLGMEEAPFKVNYPNINKLPRKLGMYLATIFMELNSDEEEEEEDKKKPKKK